MINQAKDIKLVEVAKLTPYNRNSNKHPDEQIERLCKIIRYQGFRQPLVVSNQSGMIITGNGRYLAAKKLGLTHVPVIYQDFENEDVEYAFSVSDNSIASWAELDLSMINLEIPSLGPMDIDILGIRDFNVEPDEISGKKRNKKTITCPSCGFEVS